MKHLFIILITFCVAGCASRTPDDKTKFEYPRPPYVLSIRIGGAFGESYEIVYDGRELNYYAAKSLFKIKDSKPLIITPTPEQWQVFSTRINDLNIWKWKPYYENTGVLDGTQWNCFICYNTYDSKYIVSSGNNAYPPNFDAFLAAVQKLIGGKDFQ